MTPQILLNYLVLYVSPSNGDTQPVVGPVSLHFVLVKAALMRFISCLSLVTQFITKAEGRGSDLGALVKKVALQENSLEFREIQPLLVDVIVRLLVTGGRRECPYDH